jgi:prepilin-type N-terminal cleavage/methylation domain-containing protein
MTSRRTSHLRLERCVRVADRAAFTLVELLVVVVIAVILMAVTLPTVKYSLEEGKLREGARQFNAYFAMAKARATTTGRPAGVWLELERIGDPSVAIGLYQCSQVYLAEIPAPYCGDYQNARAFVRNTADSMDPNYNTALLPPQNPPYQIPLQNPSNPPLRGWYLDFTNAASVASLMANQGALVEPGERFFIRFDAKGNLFQGVRSDSGPPYNYYIINQGVVPPRSNGIYDAMTNPNAGYSFQIYRSPKRVGQPLELPQGIVIDPNYSGLGPGGVSGPNLTGIECAGAARQMLVLFSPQGGVGKFMWTNHAGNLVENFESSQIHFLVGKTEKVEYAWNTATVPMKDHNIADGSNLWVTVNRRNGTVATVENVPSPNLPFSNVTERAAFIAAAREFASGGEVKGGQ